MWLRNTRIGFINKYSRHNVSRCLSTNLEHGKAGDVIKPFHEIPRRHPLIQACIVAAAFLPEGISRHTLKYFERKYPLGSYRLYRDNTNLTCNAVVVENTEDAEIVLRHEEKFPVRMSHPAVKAYQEKAKKPEGLVFSYGEEWYKYRKIVSKKMLRPREINAYTEEVSQIVGDFIQHVRRVREPLGSDRESEVKELDNAICKLSFENITNYIFGVRFGALVLPTSNPVAQSFITSTVDFTGSFLDVARFPMSFYNYYETKMYKRFIRSTSSLYSDIESFLKEAMKRKLKDQASEEKKHASFLDFLALNGLQDTDDISTTILDLVTGGMESTTSSTQWMLYHLGRNPEKLQKLEDEILSVLRPGEAPSPEKLQRLPYLKAVVKVHMKRKIAYSVFFTIQ